MNENGASKPRYNPKFLASGRRPWTHFSPKNVVVVDPKSDRYEFHKNELLSLSDGRKITLQQAHNAAREQLDIPAAQAYIKRMFELAPEKLNELKRKFG